MQTISQTLRWIDQEGEKILPVLKKWTGINSHSFNLAGLKAMEEELLSIFRSLQAGGRALTVPALKRINDAGEKESVRLGRCLYFQKRPKAPIQMVLMCHYDTVYPRGTSFDKAKLMSKNVLRAPGGCDAKGGILVMWLLLRALERFPQAQKIGWRMLINADEEIGSPGTHHLLARLVKGAQFGFVFEPSLPDGRLISHRKGSGNFTVIVKGIRAHAGREHHKGRNAVDALAEVITRLSGLSAPAKGLTVNVGYITGGEALNVVPDHALARFNIRAADAKAAEYAMNKIRSLIKRIDKKSGYSCTLHGGFTAPVKPLDPATKKMLLALRLCGRKIGLPVRWTSSGGVCDGNRLAHLGIPTVDTLGARGAHIHSHREIVYLNSIAQKAKLGALFLNGIAEGTLSLQEA